MLKSKSMIGNWDNKCSSCFNHIDYVGILCVGRVVLIYYTYIYIYP